MTVVRAAPLGVLGGPAGGAAAGPSARWLPRPPPARPGTEGGVPRGGARQVLSARDADFPESRAGPAAALRWSADNDEQNPPRRRRIQAGRTVSARGAGAPGGGASPPVRARGRKRVPAKRKPRRLDSRLGARGGIRPGPGGAAKPGEGARAGATWDTCVPYRGKAGGAAPADPARAALPSAVHRVAGKPARSRPSRF